MTTSEKRSISLKKAWVHRKDYHGMYGTKFHNCWRSMVTRCRGTAGEGSKKKYRDKGIRVCYRWQTFKKFMEDMLPTYKEGLTIDRIDNNLGYFKSNCRWATAEEQANNKPGVNKITFENETLTIREWCNKKEWPYNAFRLRYYRRYLKGDISLTNMMTFYNK